MKLFIAFTFIMIDMINVAAILLNSDQAEDVLVNKLFQKYVKTIRPSNTVSVKFSLQLNQIVNVIEKDQIVILNTFIDHEWVDERLKWQPAEYNNITLLRINVASLWM